MMKRYLTFPGLLIIALLFLLSMIPITTFSQLSNTRPLSGILAEVMDSLNRRPTLTYSNINIVNDLQGLPLNQFLKENYKQSLSFSENGFVILPKNLRINNCRFENGLYLDSLQLNALLITGSESAGIGISNCDFNVLNISETGTPGIAVENSHFSTLKLDQNILQFNLNLLSLHIEKDLIVTGNRATKILLEELRTQRNISLGDNNVNTIEIFKSEFNLPSEGFFRNYRFHETNAFDMVMVENVFRGDSASSVELRCNYMDLYIEENQFDADFYLLKSSVKERLIVVNNDFQRKVSFENFIFSETRNELYWNQFEGYKLAYSKNGIIFDALSPEGFKDEVKFKNLVATYKELHRIFLGRGDLKSANACYSEMKELQGQQLRYIYETEGGFNNFFRWVLNKLLKIYTNHGTDPALAVVISFYVILGFGVCYFFFPSEWDKQSKLKLLFEYRMQFKKSHKHNFRSLLSLLGIALLSLINALTLSLNSFVTLGFGTIPTRGVARYMCIIEGFMGWFLLSIFTVALINQVLA